MHPINQAVSRATTPADLTEEGFRRNPGEPDAEQSASSDYRKPTVQWRGLTIAIENPAGSVRRGRNRHGVTWEQRMVYDYGEIRGTMGVDGDPVDVFLGPHLEDALMVYVVHQRKVGDWEAYDEDKAMAGFMDEESAKIAFLANYSDPRFLGPITAIPVDEFVRKVRATRDRPAMVKGGGFGVPVLLLKTRVDDYTRNGKVVSGYDRTGPFTKGKIARVPVRGDVYRWLKIPMLPIYADYGRLAEKHPEAFKTARSAMLHVEWVFEHPEISMPASDSRFTMLIRRGSKDKCVVVNLERKKGSSGFMVRSAYLMDEGQVEKKIRGALSNPGEADRFSMRKSLSDDWGLTGAGTLSPVFLRSPVLAKGSTSSSLPDPHGSDHPVSPQIMAQHDASRTMILLFKSHVGAYVRNGKLVNLAGYQGRSARPDKAPGQIDLFTGREHGATPPLGPNPYVGKHPVKDTPDLFGDKVVEPRQEMIAEHRRLVAVLRSPSHEDDKREAVKQEAELKEYEAPAAATVTPAADLPTGATIADSKGRQYRVHYMRHGLIVAHQIIDGKPQVSADTSVRFWVDPDRDPSGDNDRTDPVTVVGMPDGYRMDGGRAVRTTEH